VIGKGAEVLTDKKKDGHKRRFASWWNRKTQAEIWTIIAGVVALVTVIPPIWGPDESPTTASSATPSPGPSVLYEGGLRLDGDSKDLDASPPASRPDVNDIWWVEKRYELDLYDNGLVALWRGAGKPGYEECYDAAYAEGSKELAVSVGRWYCIKTVESHFGAFFVEEVGKTVRGRLTVWEKS
jgi:hypothetical protein